ncbi:hypothetical protein GIW56_10145 [Pseudomonas gessardii]|uniref:Uncharacterized protein n=1 Tax=Pseudomonas gessardii TaxID=78544 RepID=A0ABS9F5L3_9PSED|nr:hypothetical protein [Pseudomonas gessardii]MCF4977893.1 hypothetical protein [Pseudomonas gessardii]MCF4988969.1 hypothetical protein [Pseudomonas gessardii]MCF5084849.1 hypothetical protein [Pseudomonas gessardii]MCF5096786.1 hypothetical protein [Pseudomonas gessardii]MCF5107201.1 hypothetical protein [Pseudomonas gessardii]
MNATSCSSACANKVRVSRGCFKVSQKNNPPWGTCQSASSRQCRVVHAGTRRAAHGKTLAVNKALTLP